MTNNREIAEKINGTGLLSPSAWCDVTYRIEKSLNEAELRGFNKAKEKAKDIAEKIALNWLSTIHIESPWDHLTVRGQCEVIRDWIESMQPDLEGNK